VSGILEFLGFSRFTLVSPLSVGDCNENLRINVGLGSQVLGSSHAIGSAGGVFRIRKRVAYRNSWQTVVVGRLEPRSSGTRIVCHTRWMLAVITFTAIWFGGLPSVAVYVALNATGGNVAVGILFIGGMLAAGAMMVRFGCTLGRDELHLLRLFLFEILDAKDEPAGPFQ